MTSFKASFDWGTQAFRETRVTPEPSWTRAGQLYGCVPLEKTLRQVVIYMYESVVTDLSSDDLPGGSALLVSSFRFASCVAVVVVNPARKRVSVSHVTTYMIKDMKASMQGLVSGMLEPLLAAMRSHPEEELHAYVSHGFPASGRDYILPALQHAFPNVRVTTGGGFAQLKPVHNGIPKNRDTYRTCLHVVMSAAAVDVFSLLLPEALVDTARGHEFAYGKVPAGWELRAYDRAIMPELRRGVGDFDWDLYVSTVTGQWAANPQLDGGFQQPGPFHLIRLRQIPDAAALAARRKVFARAWIATQNPAVMALPSSPRERGLVAIQRHAAGATVFQEACVVRAAADPTAGLTTACWSLTREVALRPQLSEELLQQFLRAADRPPHQWDAEDEAVCRRLSAALGSSNWTPARLQKLYAVVATINLAAVPPPPPSRMDEAGQPDDPGWVFQVGIYRRLSFINHGCVPNCRLDIAAGDGTITVKALRDVQAGEPLTISYLGIDRTQCSSMRDLLRAQYGFDCACDACTSVCH